MQQSVFVSRQRIQHSSRVFSFPSDLPGRLGVSKEGLCMSSVKLARRVPHGTVEFVLQVRAKDVVWQERVQPRLRFLPARAGGEGEVRLLRQGWCQWCQRGLTRPA